MRVGHGDGIVKFGEVFFHAEEAIGDEGICETRGMDKICVWGVGVGVCSVGAGGVCVEFVEAREVKYAIFSCFFVIISTSKIFLKRRGRRR